MDELGILFILKAENECEYSQIVRDIGKQTVRHGGRQKVKWAGRESDNMSRQSRGQATDKLASSRIFGQTYSQTYGQENSQIYVQTDMRRQTVAHMDRCMRRQTHEQTDSQAKEHSEGLVESTDATFQSVS